jgi:hypothetical protein
VSTALHWLFTLAAPQFHEETTICKQILNAYYFDNLKAIHGTEVKLKSLYSYEILFYIPEQPHGNFVCSTINTAFNIK